VGDGESDHVLSPERQQTVVTHNISSGETMTTYWIPPAGHWLVHCHLLLHTRPNLSAADAPSVPFHESTVSNHANGGHGGGNGLGHMGGMALGVSVSGKFRGVSSHGRVQKLKLFIRERPADNGIPSGYSYQLEDGHKRIPAILSATGPPLVLERGRPVDITVVNQLPEATSVHWHGMELESYYDGVPGWDGDGHRIAPEIEPGRSFRVQFTPPRSGTFIYHTHLNDEAQLSAGLCGPLIVFEPGTQFDPATDVIFLASRGPDPLKAPLLLNGSAEPVPLLWHAGQRYRLRLINITASNGVAFSLSGTPNLKWQPVAKDGADLPLSQAVTQEARQATLPGETFDFVFQPEQTGLLNFEISSARLNMKTVLRIEVR